MLVGAGVCFVSALVLFPRIGNTDLRGAAFSVDEPGWIAASYYYTDLVRNGDFEWQKWNCPNCGLGSSYGSLNMHLGEWLIGAPLEMDSRTKHRRFSGYYDVDNSLENNIRLGQVPPADILVQARTGPAFFGVLCCLLAFTIGFWACNVFVGLLASSLVLMNPVFLKVSAQVMTDTFYNFFLLCCCLAALAAFKTRNGKRLLLLVCFYGVMTGLACSVKVTGLIAGGLLFVLVAGWRFYTRRSGRREMFVSLALFAVFTMVTVYALNPLFWPSVREMRGGAIVQELRSLSETVVASKSIPWHSRNAFLADNRYPQLENLSHPLELPLLFPRWRHMMLEQQSRGWDNWDGPRLISLHKALIEFSIPAVVRSRGNLIVTSCVSGLFILFAAMGMASLLHAGPLKRSFRGDDSRRVLLLYFLANYLLIVLFMKLNWDRYYLPTIIALELVVALGIYEVVVRGYHYIASYSRPVSLRSQP